jgi:hypothetical protein
VARLGGADSSSSWATAHLVEIYRLGEETKPTTDGFGSTAQLDATGSTEHFKYTIVIAQIRPHAE